MVDGLGLEFVQVGGGALTVTHRPKVKGLVVMRAMGVTHLVTLLSRREGALMMGSAARAAGLEWVWVELANGREPEPPLRHGVVVALANLVPLVRDGARVVVHCSAGVHRTGMFTYALLRAGGLEPDAAAATLARLRPVTAEGVGAQRLAWAEELGALARGRLDAGPPPVRG